MNSTMPKSGQAPTSPNAMPGGLGAILQQPGGAPKGASSRSIASIMDTARKMSDMQLADVLSGKSLDVPQYVAMTEAMGRKSLRTAMQGAQAQQQVKQPSVKDKLLAEEAAAQMPAVNEMGDAIGYAGGGAIDMNESAGIASLPAPNMDSMDMASGGVVAFQEGGSAKERREAALKAVEAALPEPTMPDDYKGTLTKYLSEPDVQKAAKEREAALDAVKRNNPIYAQPTILQNAPSGSVFSAVPPKAVASSSETTPEASLPPVDNSKLKPDDKGRFIANSESNPRAGVKALTNPNQNASSSVEPQGLDAAYAAAQAKSRAGADEQYAKFADAGDKTRSGIAGLKNETQSQIYFDLMSALMGSRNLAEAGGKAGTLIAGRVGSMNKDRRALEKEANDFDFNITKAKEAAASGNMKAYNEYMQNADMAKYHGMVGKAALMNASATANAPDNKMSIAVGNKVMEDVQKRLKDDVRFRNDWNKMSPQQQAAYYQQQYNIASSVYSGKMDPAVFGGPQVAFSKEQTDLLNKYK